MFKRNNWPVIDVTRKSVEENSINFKNYRNKRKINENNIGIKKRCKKTNLEKNNVDCEVIVSNVDEDEIKASLLLEGADPLSISKFSKIKSIKVSNKNPDRLVLGADSVISLSNELINKPKTRDEALEILKNSIILNTI